MSLPDPLGGLLFDLDGTFADTAPDLAYALNQTLMHFGQAPLPFEQIRPVVSHGGVALIKLGFGLSPDDAGYQPRREHLLTVYQNNIARHTRLFDGIDDVITAAEAADIPWGIVTNKPSWLTDPLMDALQLTQRAGAIVSGDTCARAKPYPDPVLHACKLIDMTPERCVYVGDAERDIAAGRAAGSATVAARFGYLMTDDDPAHWQADYLIDHAAELLPLLGLNDANRHVD